MEQPHYFTTLLSVCTRPGLYGIHDALELRAFALGYDIASPKSGMTQLLGHLTEFLKREDPYWRDNTCDWSHIVKAHSVERGGSMKLFKTSLTRMLLEQGDWSDEHAEIFLAKEVPAQTVLQTLPAPSFMDGDNE